MPACEQCGRAFVRARSGRPRRYCSETCRKAAFRERRSFVAPSDLIDPVDADTLNAWTAQALASELAGSAPASPLDQLASAVGQTEMLAAEYQRLAHSTPRALAWRSGEMATVLLDAVHRLFPKGRTHD